jgi:hypothetical protein
LSAGTEELARIIADEHATWDDPLVCREIFGTHDPIAIADLVEELCVRASRATIVRARFYRVSVGSVAGLDLSDGRSVVAKFQRGGRSERYLEACLRVRRALADSGFPCPRPIAGPLRLGNAWATLEELDERGSAGDAHDPAVRRELASTLARLVDLARPFATDPAFGGAWFTSIPDDRIFPKPHSPLFDFSATAGGAEWIDDLAARARAHRTHATGDVVLGHFDWRIEHVRLEAGRIVTSYDWDSLHAELEPVLLGATLHAFTADWQREDLVRVPTLDEMRAFLSDYESARGRPFTSAERTTLSASLVYSLSYTARCNQAVNPKQEGWNGDFRPFLRAHGDSLVTRGL